MFQELLLKPIYNALVFIASRIPGNDLGISVVVLVLAIRFLLWPLFNKAAQSQALMKKIQPEMDRIRKIHKDDQVKQAQELMALYKKNHFNPFSSILILFIQLPVLIALYQVFLKGATGIDQSLLYPGVNHIIGFQTLFLGFFELAKPNLFLAVLAAATQGVASYLTGKGSKDMSSRWLLIFSPVMTLVIVMQLPSVVAWYWSLTTIFSIIQQLIIEKRYQDGRNS